jgi:subtilisin family serine protease
VDSYVILRNLGLTPAGDPFGGPTLGPSAQPGVGPEAPPEPRIDVEVLDRRDRADLMRDPEVAGVARLMPTRLIEPMASGGDDNGDDGPGDGVAWGVKAVRADASEFTGKDVVVAVLDTGIDATHAAFAGMELIEKDFSGSGNGDVQGHGTHCAGTIFGRDVDGTRIGVARGVSKALIGKVLRNDGRGDSDMIFRGITWAVEGGANIVSMSLGFDFPGLVKRLTDQGWPTELATSQALEAYRGNLRVFDSLMAMVHAREAFGSGTVLVAAAGNESRRDEDPNFEIAAGLPAAAEGMVSVGALGRDGGKLSVAPFSNTFPVVTAPGVDVVSAKVGGGLRKLNGTSMATPCVAGVVALWWESVQSLGLRASAPMVAAKLRANARIDVFAPGHDAVDRGAGIVTAP